MSYTPSTAEILYSDYQATLNNGSEIDSGWLDMEAYDKVQFSGYSDKTGLTMTIESKVNDTTAPTQITTPVTYTEGTFYLFNVICRQRFMRFRWTNNTGAVANDASMEIKAFVGSSDKLSVLPLSVQPSAFSQANLTQAVVRGLDNSGMYQNVAVNKGRAMSVADFDDEIARGVVDDFLSCPIQALNTDVDTGSSPEIIASFGGTWTPIVGSSVLSIASSSALDTLAGTGARVVLVEGVDGSGLVSELVNLSGTTPVLTANTYTGVNRISVVSAGSTTVNQGDITATAGTPQAEIPTGFGVSQQLIHFAPVTHDVIVKRITAEVQKTTGGSNPEVTIKGYYIYNGVRYQMIETILRADTRPYWSSAFEVPFRIPAGAYYWATVSTDTNNTFVRATIEQVRIIL